MIHGIINVYKEKGFTSHDVVAKLRGIVGQKKIGHTGTLDPDAVGVLPVCLGKATKVCELLTDKDKTYETVLLLGKETDTQDTSGEVLVEKPTDSLTEDMVTEVIRSFLGDYEQVPPMYSALKVNGKKLYELAREGKTVERKARKVKIHNIEIKEINLPRVRMEVECSKGTYIRTLCHDIGHNLGCGGCMEELKRTKVSCFELADSYKLSEIADLKAEGKLSEILTPIDAMFDQYKKAVVSNKWAPLVYNGNAVAGKAFALESYEKVLDKEKVRVYDGDMNFIALYQYDAKKDEYSIIKMFYSKSDM